MMTKGESETKKKKATRIKGCRDDSNQPESQKNDANVFVGRVKCFEMNAE